MVVGLGGRFGQWGLRRQQEQRQHMTPQGHPLLRHGPKTCPWCFTRWGGVCFVLFMMKQTRHPAVTEGQDSQAESGSTPKALISRFSFFGSRKMPSAATDRKAVHKTIIYEKFMPLFLRTTTYSENMVAFRTSPRYWGTL